MNSTLDELLLITQEKLKLSEDILNITKIIKSRVDDFEFADIDNYFLDRQKIIDNVDDLDKHFLKKYEELKKDLDFENELSKNQELSKTILRINQNFKSAYELDIKILPLLEDEFSDICLQMKKINEKATVTDKYSQDSIHKVTKANFGIFIDEKK